MTLFAVFSFSFPFLFISGWCYIYSVKGLGSFPTDSLPGFTLVRETNELVLSGSWVLSLSLNERCWLTEFLHHFPTGLVTELTFKPSHMKQLPSDGAWKVPQTAIRFWRKGKLSKVIWGKWLSKLSEEKTVLLGFLIPFLFSILSNTLRLIPWSHMLFHSLFFYVTFLLSSCDTVLAL